MFLFIPCGAFLYETLPDHRHLSLYFKFSARSRDFLDLFHKSYNSTFFYSIPHTLFHRFLHITSSIPAHDGVSSANFTSQQSTCYPRLIAAVFNTFSWRCQAPFLLPLFLKSPCLYLPSFCALNLCAIDLISHILSVFTFVNF